MSDTDVPTEPNDSEPTSSESQAASSTEAAKPTRTLRMLRERPPAIAYVGLAIALIVGLAVGGIIGIKFEQGRAKDDIKAIRQHSKKALAAAKAESGKTVRMIGKVDRLSLTTVSVVSQGAPIRINVDKGTVVQKAGPGNASAITAGTHVVWKNVEGSKTKAAEVIVLPTWARLGVVITDASPTSMTYGTATGKLQVSTAGADIQGVTASRLNVLRRGTPVMLQVRQVKGKPGYATEIIVLEPGSKFT
jgi:hypothetical protein